MNAKRKQTQAKTQSKGKRLGRGKRIALWSLLVIVVGLAVLTAVRWRSWFGNTPEAPYTTPNVIDRITLTPGMHFGSERAVSWRCGETLGDGWLEYRTDSTAKWALIPAQGQLVETRNGRGCYYSAQIHGLKPGAQVEYRVRVGQLQSDVQRFTMSRDLDQELRLVYLGDVQDPTGEMSREHFAYLRDSVIPTFRPHLFAAAGDQIEGPTDTYWQVWYDALAGMQQTIPMVLATGNHEYLKRGLMRELDPRWTAQHHYPNNGPEGFEGRSYYVDTPIARFIVIDSNDINDPMAIIGHREWLASALRSSAQPWQIVMFHHAVACVREGRSNLVMQYTMRSVLEEWGADLVLQGHDHAYSRWSLRGDSGELVAPVYIISTSSPKVYRNGFDPIHDRLGSGLRLYQTISLTPSRIDYRSYQYTGEPYDHIEIQHAHGQGGKHRIIDHAQGWSELFLFDNFGSGSKAERKAKRYREEVEMRQSTQP